MRWASGSWPPSKPARDVVAGALALGAAAGGLAALPADAAADAAACAFLEPGGGLQVVDLHQSLTSSTVMRCGTRAIIPRISGRSGSVLVLPMPREAEGPQRAAVLRLGADGRLHLGDLEVGHHATSVGTWAPRWRSR